MASPLVPARLPVATARLIAGMSTLAFEQHVLMAGLIELDERGRVVTTDLERFLGREVTVEMYLAADRRRDRARQYQYTYRQRRRQNATEAHNAA